MASDITLPPPPRPVSYQGGCTLAIAGCLALVLLGGLAYTAIGGWWDAEFEAGAERAVGTVREWSVSRDGKARYLHYRFAAEGRQYRGKTQVDDEQFGTIPEGGPVSVAYQAGRPERHVIGPRIRSSWVPLALLIVPLMLLLLGGLLWHTRHQTRLARLARDGEFVVGRATRIARRFLWFDGWSVWAAYDTPDGTTHEARLSFDTLPALEIGDPVPMVVDPDQPGVAASVWEVTRPGAEVVVRTP